MYAKKADTLDTDTHKHFRHKHADTHKHRYTQRVRKIDTDTYQQLYT